VHQALIAAGHQVTLVAPELDNSGIGAASVVSPGQALAVTELAPGKYCVGAPAEHTPEHGKNGVIGTPVDAVNVGLDLLLKNNPPDLVVSGTNFGDNVGPLTQMSGTVNAAVRAMFKGVPAIAVSTAIDLELIMRDRQTGYLKTLNALDDTANFTVKVIQQASAAGARAKQQCDKSGGKAKPFCELNVLGLPGTIGLNLNYPALESGEVQGISYAPIGDWGMVGFQAQRGGDGVVRVNLVAPETPTLEQQQLDAHQLFTGKAVITVIDGNLTAPEALHKQATQMFEGLTP
jgi:5'-nucleotidase